jgi:ketosteroid isomerase-like protein
MSITESGREKFRRLGMGDLAAHTWLVRQRTQADSLERRIEMIEQSHRVRDRLISYAYHYDAGDVDGVMEHFTEDAVLVSTRGTYVGKSEVERNYRWVNTQRKITYHRVVNDVVRLDADLSQAWLTAYFMTMGLGLDDVRRSMMGNYFIRLEKHADSWYFADMKIGISYSGALSAGPMTTLAGAGMPEPTLAETSDDWARAGHS